MHYLPDILPLTFASKVGARSQTIRGITYTTVTKVTFLSLPDILPLTFAGEVGPEVKQSAEE